MVGLSLQCSYRNHVIVFLQLSIVDRSLFIVHTSSSFCACCSWHSESCAILGTCSPVQLSTTVLDSVGLLRMAKSIVLLMWFCLATRREQLRTRIVSLDLILGKIREFLGPRPVLVTHPFLVGSHLLLSCTKCTRTYGRLLKPHACLARLYT